MDKILITKYPNRFWQVAKIEKFRDDNLVETIMVNRFMEVNEDWVLVFDTVGGSGTGYSKGELLRKISTSNSEVSTVIGNPNDY